LSVRSARPAGWRLSDAGYWCYALHLWTLFGLALSNAFVGLTVLSVPWSVPWKKIDWNRLRPIFLPLGFYTLFLFASVLASDQPRASASGLGELSSLATLLFAPLLVRGEYRTRQVIDGLLIMAGGSAAVGLGQYLLGWGDINQRLRGPFSHYMTFAGVLLLADLVLISQLSCGRGRRDWWRWLVLLTVNLALLGTLTRSAWLGFLFGLLLLAVIRAPRYLLAFAPAVLLFVVLAPVSLVHRVTSIGNLKDISNYDRLCMAEAGFHIIAERPLLGIGPEMVRRRYPIYRHPTAPRPTVPHLHNSYLSLAAERGLLSLAAMLALLGGAAWTAVRMYVTEGGAHGPRADLLLGMLVAVAAFCLAGLFESNWADSEVQRIVLFLLALPFCLEPYPVTVQASTTGF